MVLWGAKTSLLWLGSIYGKRRKEKKIYGGEDSIIRGGEDPRSFDIEEDIAEKVEEEEPEPLAKSKAVKPPSVAENGRKRKKYPQIKEKVIRIKSRTVCPWIQQ
ncbi:unnamed protein product [Victoria cruziana]